MIRKDDVLVTLPQSDKPWTLFKRKEFIVAFSAGADNCAIFRADGQPTGMTEEIIDDIGRYMRGETP